ncbi:MAG: hypothetical protein ACJATO_001447 [Arenicella sp.]|jgi:hypothetical protein
MDRRKSLIKLSKLYEVNYYVRLGQRLCENALKDIISSSSITLGKVEGHVFNFESRLD